MVLSYKGLATLLFGGIVDRYGDAFSFVKESLPKADIKITFRSYMSMVFLSSAIAYFLALITTYIIFTTVVPILGIALALYLTFIPLLMSLTIFFSLCFSPYQRMLSKRRNIETNLPFVLTHMGAIAESGVPPSVIFRLIGEFEEYGEVAKEMKKITRNMDTFGIDPLTAVKEVAKHTASDDLKQVLLGFVTTTESGGDLTAFLRNAGQRALFEWRMKRERFVQQLTTYAEFYTGLFIAAPLFIISLFAVMHMISGTVGGYDILELMKLSIYGVIPVVNTAFVLVVKGIEVEI
ncbi:MAG: type II secretion system F family protein [Candidatus Aenigmarchaeota archaeon]|nr:type II secretion system F family protein [Candidatus Aenigmarchaeota archaeon]